VLSGGDGCDGTSSEEAAGEGWVAVARGNHPLCITLGLPGVAFVLQLHLQSGLLDVGLDEGIQDGNSREL
jgi:hypothetical protein